jgi:hypothetical protein
MVTMGHPLVPAPKSNGSPMVTMKIVITPEVHDHRG